MTGDDEIPFELTAPSALGPANDNSCAWGHGPAERRAAGRRARNAGEDLERWLATQHSLAVATKRVSWVAKISAGARYTTLKCGCGRVHRVLQWADKACADFVGFLPNGKTLVVEAKSVEGSDGGRFYRKDIRPQQVEQLDAAADASGLALLVVEFRETGRVLVKSSIAAMPWRIVPWQRLRSADSLSLADVRPWLVRQGLYLDPLLKGVSRA